MRSKSLSELPETKRGTAKDKQNARQRRHRSLSSPAGKQLSQTASAIRQRRFKEAQKVQEAEARAAELEMRAEKAEARATIAEAKAEQSNKEAEMYLTAMLIAQADFDKATRELEQLQEAMDEARKANRDAKDFRKEMLELKQRNGQYKPAFMLMCVRVLFAGVPECRASEVIRAVLEYAHGARLSHLKLPARSTYERMSEAGKIWAQAIAAKLVADAKAKYGEHAFLALYIDATAKFNRQYHTSLLQTPDGAMLSLCWLEIATKSAEDQLEACLYMLDQMEEAGDFVFNTRLRGETLFMIVAMMADGGNCETAFCKKLEAKESGLKADGVRANKAKEQAHVERPFCCKHIVDNMLVEVQAQALAYLDLGDHKRPQEFVRAVKKALAKKSAYGHAGGHK